MSSSSKTRPPDPADLDAWSHLTQSVRPLPDRPKPKPAKPVVRAEPVARPKAAAPAAPSAKPKAVPTQPLESLAGLDGRNAERFRRGQMPLDATLDLHGMTQDEAHGALMSFLDRCYAAGRRNLLIVTGKGRLGDGVLKRALPRWLNEPGQRARIVAIAGARQNHGGGGATYVLLKRKR